MIQPNTTIYLCDTPLHKDNKHQFTFTNATKQLEYFTSKVKFTYNNSVYVRKDQPISVNFNIETIRTCNYVFYQNASYTNKVFFAFIDKMEYVNDNTTNIFITTDVFQTYYFDIQYNTCFVEREHVNDDTVGKHTLPEGLETGEYIINNQAKDTSFNDYCILTNTSSSLDDYLNYFACDLGNNYISGNVWLTPGFDGLALLMRKFSDEGKADAINNVWLVPKSLISNYSQYDFETNKFVHWGIGQHEPVSIQFTQNKPTTIKSYTPRNKKLLTYPYCYLMFSNNNGTTNTLQYELFSGNTYTIQYKGVPSVGGSIVAYPLNYKGFEESLQDTITLGKYPTLSWSSDAYTNWLTQNSINLGFGQLSAGLSIAGGFVETVVSGITGSGAGEGISDIGSGLSKITDIMSQKYQHSLIPQTSSGNTNGGDILTSTGYNTIIYSQMCIKEEYAKIIDKYFDQYGYQVNDLKVPNITGRRNWNYVKTIDANMTGNIPDDDMDKIRAMFNNGVTLWHNPANIFNYSLNNDII